MTAVHCFLQCTRIHYSTSQIIWMHEVNWYAAYTRRVYKHILLFVGNIHQSWRQYLRLQRRHITFQSTLLFSCPLRTWHHVRVPVNVRKDDMKFNNW